MALATLREEVTARLQDSAPGHEVTSRGRVDVGPREADRAQRDVEARAATGGRPRERAGSGRWSAAASRRRSGPADLRERAQLRARDVAQEEAHVDGRVAVLALVDDARAAPREVARGRGTGRGLDGWRGHVGRVAPAASAPPCASASTCARCSAYAARKPSSPSLRSTYFMRARCLLSRFPRAWKRRTSASPTRPSSAAGMNSWSTMAA